ncbi:MAG: biopolymer transporter ExbD [Planctomycetes bacterium]|nr:biopolymer transporter ExbD [Planctomycetota bacterium]
MPLTINKGLSSGGLNLTPMIDVVFLLLIFFLVATRFEQEERDMEVDLPRAIAVEPTMNKSREIFVTVTPDGDYFVDGQRLDSQRLTTVLKAAYRANPGRQRVTIRADKESRTRHVVAVMDACNQAHIRQYSLAAE